MPGPVPRGQRRGKGPAGRKMARGEAPPRPPAVRNGGRQSFQAGAGARARFARSGARRLGTRSPRLPPSGVVATSTRSAAAGGRCDSPTGRPDPGRGRAEGWRSSELPRMKRRPQCKRRVGGQSRRPAHRSLRCLTAMESFEAGLLHRMAHAPGGGEVSVDLLTDLRTEMERARELPQEEGHALAVRDTAGRMGLPGDQVETMSVTQKAQLPVTQQQVLRRMLAGWLWHQERPCEPTGE